MTKKTKVVNPTAPREVQADTKPRRFKSLAPPPVGASPKGWHRISTFFECKQKYKLAEVWGIRVPQMMTPDPLAVGGLFHAARAWWFNQGFPPLGEETDEAMMDYVRDAAMRMDLPVREEAILNTMKYARQYVEYWGSRMKPTVLGTEYLLSGSIPGVTDGSHRTARLDDVSEYPEAQGKLCIGECKTTSVSVADAVQEYTLHGQTMKQDMLWTASKEGLAKHGPVEYILLDVVVKGYGKDKCQFGRVPIRIYDFARTWYARDLASAVREAESIDTNTPVERNITACTRFYGRMRVDCAYKPMCQMGRQAALRYVDREGTSLAHAKYQGEGPKPWD